MKPVANRERKIAEAKGLRLQDMTYKEIGDRLGVTSNCVMKWCKPELAKEMARRSNAKRNAAKREWEAGECPKCGNRMTHAKRDSLCKQCAIEAIKQTARERTERFIEFRKQGLLNVEIAAREGVEPGVVNNVLSKAGRYGLTVPRSPYFVK